MNELTNQEYKVKLDIFEGPLDLLLYLIKKNEVDIYNIPIALISEQYIDYLALMKTLNLDIAGEFLLMSATLAHIKSQMLVPTPLPSDMEGEISDPRAELARQLVEYQRYKDAAEELLKRKILGRDVFKRDKNLTAPAKPAQADRELLEISIFNLIDAFSKLLKKMPEDFPQEFYIEKLTIKERIGEIVELISAQPEGSISFYRLFSDLKNRSAVIITFLALLEMIKMNLLKVMQTKSFGEIIVSATTNLLNGWKDEDDFERTN